MRSSCRSFRASNTADRYLGTTIEAVAREAGGSTQTVSRRPATCSGPSPPPEVTLRLIVRRGWSADRAEAWLAEAMVDALLGPGG